MSILCQSGMSDVQWYFIYVYLIKDARDIVIFVDKDLIIFNHGFFLQSSFYKSVVLYRVLFTNLWFYNEFFLQICGSITSSFYSSVVLYRVLFTNLWFYTEFYLQICGSIPSSIYISVVLYRVLFTNLWFYTEFYLHGYALAALNYKKERDQYIFQGQVRLRHFLGRALRLEQTKGPSAASRTGSISVL